MKTTYLFVILSILLTLNSCGDDEILDQAVLIQNHETFIEAIESEDFITIRVESLADTTFNQGSNFVPSDYCNISFDINSNKKIDPDVDFLRLKVLQKPNSIFSILHFQFSILKIERKCFIEIEKSGVVVLNIGGKGSKKSSINCFYSK